MLSKILNDKIFEIDSLSEFNEIAIKIFHYQYNNNIIYKQFVDFNFIDITKIYHFSEIPFLPIDLFKTQKVICNNNATEKIFESSGTTSNIRSKHYICSLNLYEKSFLSAFEYFYGNIKDYCFLALLPNYSEQQNSSLIYMINRLIKETGHKDSNFYLYDLKALSEKLIQLDNHRKKIILFGVTYSLLDLAEKYPVKIPDAIIFETGGMKGRRKEMLREELHLQLKHSFGVPSVHGEYGMTELLSQAYSKSDGIFETPPWMKILIRDINDPFRILDVNKSGAINIIDLANIETCSFIATQDMGKVYQNGKFEVSGRLDNSDLRGCNLMIN